MVDHPGRISPRRDARTREDPPGYSKRQGIVDNRSRIPSDRRDCHTRDVPVGASEMSVMNDYRSREEERDDEASRSFNLARPLARPRLPSPGSSSPLSGARSESRIDKRTEASKTHGRRRRDYHGGDHYNMDVYSPGHLTRYRIEDGGNGDSCAGAPPSSPRSKERIMADYRSRVGVLLEDGRMLLSDLTLTSNSAPPRPERHPATTLALGAVDDAGSGDDLDVTEVPHHRPP